MEGFYLSSKYKSHSSGNGKEGEEEGGESKVGHQQGFHLDNWTIGQLDIWTIGRFKMDMGNWTIGHALGHGHWTSSTVWFEIWMTLDCTIDEKEDTQSKVVKQETVRLRRDMWHGWTGRTEIAEILRLQIVQNWRALWHSLGILSTGVSDQEHSTEVEHHNKTIPPRRQEYILSSIYQHCYATCF